MADEIMSPSQFFETAYQNFLSAAEKNGKTALFYRLVGSNFCLQFASDFMIEELTAALAHLKIESRGIVDFTVSIWDSVSTGAPPLEFPWEEEAKQFRGEVNGYTSLRIYTVIDIHTKALHMIDLERKLALYWISDFRNLPWWVSGSPFQLLFHWWMHSLGYQLTHAAAVGSSKAGVLLTGKSGSGKSTTVLSCMKAGMRFVGEDYCLLGDSPTVWAYSIYNSAKIDNRTLNLFPSLIQQVVNPNRKEADKAFLFHQRFQPEKMIASLPIKALVVLNISDSGLSKLQPIQPKEALGALSLTTLWQLTHTGPAVFKHLQRVAERLPCYRLYLGIACSEIPRLIQSLL